MRLAAISLVFLLSACFEAETVMRVNPDRTITAISRVVLGRWLYDREFGDGKGDDFCAGGDQVETGDEVSCTIWHRAGLGKFRLASANGQATITAVAISDELIRVEIPVRMLKDDLFKTRTLDAGAKRSLRLARPFIGRAMQDRYLIYAIEGFRVEKTNGVLSEDGKRAEIAIPIAALIGGNVDVPEMFFAEVRFEACRVAFFCR